MLTEPPPPLVGGGVGVARTAAIGCGCAGSGCATPARRGWWQPARRDGCARPGGCAARTRALRRRDGSGRCSASSALPCCASSLRRSSRFTRRSSCCALSSDIASVSLTFAVASSLSLRIRSATSVTVRIDGRLEPARMYARAARCCTMRFKRRGALLTLDDRGLDAVRLVLHPLELAQRAHVARALGARGALGRGDLCARRRRRCHAGASKPPTTVGATRKETASRATANRWARATRTEVRDVTEALTLPAAREGSPSGGTGEPYP